MNSKIKFCNKEFLQTDSKNTELLAKADFEGKFGQHFYDYNTDILHFGIDYSTDNLVINDFEKANYKDLGYKVKELLPKIIQTITIDDELLTEQNLLSFLFGVRQGEYKFVGNTEVKKTRLGIKFSKYINSPKIAEFERINLGVELSKNLLNMRADHLNPISYPIILLENMSELPSWVNIKVIPKDQIDALGMNWLAGVGRSSKFGYQLLIVEIEPKNTVRSTVALIGKGLTFDNGGVNIKEGGNSFGMHSDMGGSAIVFGAAKALSLLEQPEHTKYVFVSGLVENGLDTNAMHPGDILENIVGQTTMVKNTDAEGRLTLGDVAPWTVINYQPSKLITLATLTGHAIVAYTAKVAPIFANDKTLQGELYNAFLNTQEEVVMGVLPKDVEKAIEDKSKIADTINTHNYTQRQGGSQSAAAYVMRTSQPKLWKKNRTDNLPEYVPTAHIDVAGPVTDDQDLATGYGVRAIVEFCKQQDKI